MSMMYSAIRAFWENDADRGGFYDEQYLKVLRYQRKLEVGDDIKLVSDEVQV